MTLGLAGWLPAQADPDAAAKLIEEVRQHGKLTLAGSQSIEFRIDRDIHWHYKESLPYHPNALTLHAYDAQGGVLHRGTFYSVGGGFVVTEAEAQSPTTRGRGARDSVPVRECRRAARHCRAREGEHRGHHDAQRVRRAQRSRKCAAGSIASGLR